MFTFFPVESLVDAALVLSLLGVFFGELSPTWKENKTVSIWT